MALDTRRDPRGRSAPARARRRSRRRDAGGSRRCRPGGSRRARFWMRHSSRCEVVRSHAKTSLSVWPRHARSASRQASCIASSTCSRVAPERPAPRWARSLAPRSPRAMCSISARVTSRSDRCVLVTATTPIEAWGQKLAPLVRGTMREDGITRLAAPYPPVRSSAGTRSQRARRSRRSGWDHIPPAVALSSRHRPAAVSCSVAATALAAAAYSRSGSTTASGRATSNRADARQWSPAASATGASHDRSRPARPAARR